MSVSLDQLRAALTESANTPALAVTDRMAGIRGQVAARRRRRAGGYAAGIAAVAVVAVLATTSVVGQRRAEQPAAPRNPDVNGLPLYAHGGRQIGSARVPLHAGLNHLFTATPTSYGLTVALGCTGSLPTGRPQGMTLRINGEDTVGTDGGRCGGGPTGESVSATGGSTEAAQQRYWAGAGVRPGQPVSVDVVVAGTPSARTTARVALYQDVPLAEYPLPARPAKLWLDPTFGRVLKQSREVVLPGRAATGSWSVTLPYDARLEVAGFTSSPGEVEVRVAGQLVGQASSWTYSGNGFQLPIDPDALRLAQLPVPSAGTPTTITVTVNRFAERTWRLFVGRSELPETSTG
jgi:hypothetical protein